MKTGDFKLNCKIIDYSYQGLGIARVDNFVVFIPYAVYGNLYNIKITEVKKNFAFGKIIDFEPTPVPCPYYYKCGGCHLQHLDYKQQLGFKNQLMMSNCKRNHIDCQLNMVVASPEEWGYRNKLSLPATMVDGRLALGFFASKSHNVVPIETCLNGNQFINKYIPIVEECLNQIKEVSYNRRTRKGNVRHVMIRGHNITGVVTIVTKTGRLRDESTFESLMRARGINNIVINKQPKDNSEILGITNRTLCGSDSVTLTIDNDKFAVKPNAFFQVNQQVNNLIIKFIKHNISFENKIVLDAFCGTGTLGLSLCAQVTMLIGIDIEPQAIACAKENSKRMGFKNTKYICGDIEHEINHLKQPFDIVIVDPPRQGLLNKFIQLLITTKPSEIIYISCDPNTLFRDIKSLSSCYKVKKIQPFDMFPNTYHLENVVLLSRIEQ